MKKILLGFLLMFVMLITGCATIMTGTSNTIQFNSNVPGAKVFIDNEYVGTTPLTLEVSTKETPNVRIEAPGYLPYTTTLKKDVSGWIWGNIIAGGIFGLGIDFITGGVYVYRTKTVNGELEKIPVGKLQKAN